MNWETMLGNEDLWYNMLEKYQIKLYLKSTNGLFAQ